MFKVKGQSAWCTLLAGDVVCCCVRYGGILTKEESKQSFHEDTRVCGAVLVLRSYSFIRSELLMNLVPFSNTVV